ncbi:MAG: CpaF family protein [Armatimonadota bacterium]|jgi:pilus assembly protein CpaF
MGVLSDNKTQPGGEGFNQNQNYGSGTPDLAALERKIHQKLMEEVDPEQLSKLDRASMANEIQIVMYAVLAQEGIALPARARERMVANIIDEIIGYGPIQPLLEDPNISEVMVNSAKKVYAERSGKIFLTDKVFRDDAHILRIIEKIVSPLGRRIDEASPMVDARLPDGSRVNAIIPPIAISGPTLTIRKFSKDPYTVDDLVGFGSLTKEMADFLKACVLARLNIIVSGGTGSGKTTTLNVLSSFIPNDERIVTIEDAAELQLQQDHIVTLEARPSNLEGRGEISIRMLVKNSLRMRPDRIVIGECRGGEALDMLQAMNTGHDGSLTTAHANSPRHTMSRLETMTLMAGTELPAKAIREQIATAIQLVVQQSRLRDGSRKVTHITEVQGLEGDTVVLQDIFKFDQKGVDANGKVIGKLVATGLRPKFMDKLTQQGISLPPDIFEPEESIW